NMLSALRPGLTGIGSIVFRNEEAILAASPSPRRVCYEEEILPRKAELEKWYVVHHGAAVDMRILLATVWVVLFPASRIYERLFPSLPVTGIPVTKQAEE